MLVFFSNQRVCLFILLSVNAIFSLLSAPNKDPVAVQREAARLRRLRASYRYVQEVLSPPKTEFEDFWSLKSRVMQAGRMLGITALSWLGSEIGMFLLHRIPWVKNTINTIEQRIKDCHKCIAVAAEVSRRRTQLREYFLGKERIDLAQGVDATVIPNFQDHILTYIERQSKIEDILGWIKKGIAGTLFFVLCHYYGEKKPATWTYKSILENAIARWPEHQYFFPRELRPRFSLLYDVYMARHKKLALEEDDAQRFIEWTCLEVIDTLILL
ncbi:hypothetical protein FJ365_02415 [Candidatus Dependentiae bacterium]|nr:hypothetical protein [Candidatus Dependentiae bacterium]